MLARFRKAGLVIPTLMTLAVLPVLIGLGTWQWHRLAWKENLIAQIESRRTAEPVAYTQVLARHAAGDDVSYTRVQIAGAFDHTIERHVYAPLPQGSGWHVYTWFQPEGGAAPLFVNRGWVPDARKDPGKRVVGQSAPPVTMTGLVRLPEQKGWFTPEPDRAGNRWYARDIEGMRSGLGAPTGASNMAPFSIDAEAVPANPGGWPRGGTTEIRLSNAHLQYVVTWYGLALTLIGVYIAFARQRLAEMDQPPR